MTSRPEYRADTITLKSTNSTFVLNAPSTRTPIPYNQISAIWFTRGEQHNTTKEVSQAIIFLNIFTHAQLLGPHLLRVYRCHHWCQHSQGNLQDWGRRMDPGHT